MKDSALKLTKTHDTDIVLDEFKAIVWEKAVTHVHDGYGQIHDTGEHFIKYSQDNELVKFNFDLPHKFQVVDKGWLGISAKKK